MADACPVLTPDQRRAAEIMDSARSSMMEKVHAAIAEAATQIREQVLAADLDIAPVPMEYFHAVVHQQMYLTICGATVETFEGGNVKKAVGLIRNQQQIANRYWGADIAVTPEA